MTKRKQDLQTASPEISVADHADQTTKSPDSKSVSKKKKLKRRETISQESLSEFQHEEAEEAPVKLNAAEEEEDPQDTVPRDEYAKLLEY